MLRIVPRIAFLVLAGGVLFLLPTKSRADIIAKEGSTVHASDGSNVTAGKGATVYAESGSRVTALEGATVHAASKSRVGVNGAVTVHTQPGALVQLHKACSVNEPNKPTVEYCEGADIEAFGSGIRVFKGALVRAKQGSVVEALDGSIVYAEDGSTVTAKTGSIVYGTPTATVTAESGSTVHAVASAANFPTAVTDSKLVLGRWENVSEQQGHRVVVEMEFDAKGKMTVKVKSMKAINPTGPELVLTPIFATKDYKLQGGTLEVEKKTSKITKLSTTELHIEENGTITKF